MSARDTLADELEAMFQGTSTTQEWADWLEYNGLTILTALRNRTGMERAAEIAESEKVDAEETGEAEDRAYNKACDHIAAAIRREAGQ